MAAANHASNSFSKKTLFVRGLPYSTSDADLEESFSECGPVKTCFTIKETGVCLPVWSISGLSNSGLPNPQAVYIGIFDSYSRLSYAGSKDCKGFGYVVFCTR